jgi:hypothetical protein
MTASAMIKPPKPPAPAGFLDGPGQKRRRSIHDLLAPARALAEGSRQLFYMPLEQYVVGADFYQLPSFVFIGPRQGGNYLRLGVFAGIHGDETGGVLGSLAFIKALVKKSRVAEGWEIFIYPVCNPQGFEDNTRFTRRGGDLNRQFWQARREPEVRILQKQLESLRFDGIVSLHADDTSDGMYGFARGAQITREVLRPVLAAAGKILPVNGAEQIDGFQAREGIVNGCYEGVLGAPPTQRPKPFEIILETPQLADLELQAQAHAAGLMQLLGGYRSFISYGQDL